MTGAGTPATVALAAAGVAFTLHPYDHDPATPSFGAEAAAALGLPAEQVFKTLLVDTGTGPAVTASSRISVFYTGWLLNGTVFDSARTDGAPASFALSGLIEGWKQGLLGMQLGGIRRLYIPANLAYGSAGQGNVPPNSDLIFEIKLVSLA